MKLADFVKLVLFELYPSPHGDEMKPSFFWPFFEPFRYPSPHGDEMKRCYGEQYYKQMFVSVPAWG